jgi:hypothetical protein
VERGGKERELEHSLNLPKQFTLCANGSSMGEFNLKVNTEFQIIYVRKLDGYSIFDWMGVVEKASEIHCVDSSFIHLVESMENITNKLYYHDVRRSRTGFTRRKNWKCPR